MSEEAPKSPAKKDDDHKTEKVTRPKRSANRDLDHYVRRETHERVVNERPDCRLLVIAHDGSGKVFWVALDPRCTTIVNYKPKEEEWGATLELQDFVTVVMGNALYVIGGRDTAFNNYVATVKRYDPFRKSWQDLCPLTEARAHHTAVVIGEQIHVMGGLTRGGKPTTSCEIYQEDSDTWCEGQPLEFPRYNMAACTLGGEGFVCGGRAARAMGAARDLWAFNGYKWTTVDKHYPVSLAHGLEKHVLTAADDTLFFIGGKCHVYPDSSDEEDVLDIDDVTATNIKPKHVAVTGRVDAFRMRVRSSETKHTGSLITPWEHVASDMRQARHSAGLVKLGDRLVVVGGTGSDDQPVTTAEAFHVEKRTWHDLFEIPEGGDSLKKVSAAILDYGKRISTTRTTDASLQWPLW